MTSENDDLTPSERRELAIAATAAKILRVLLHEEITAIESAAAESAEGDESDKPVMAKVAVAVEWPAGASAPKIEVKLGYSVKHRATGFETCDPAQMKFDITAEPMEALS